MLVSEPALRVLEAMLMLQLAARMSLTTFRWFLFTPTSLVSSEPDGFALGEVVTSAHTQNVLYCVASNFLEVKQLASTLLRQLPPSTVGLQVSIWTELTHLS